MLVLRANAALETLPQAVMESTAYGVVPKEGPPVQDYHILRYSPLVRRE